MRPIPRFARLAVAIVALACDGSSQTSPTSPALIDNLSGASFWKGTFVLEEASPRGNCVVEGFIDHAESKQLSLRADAARLDNPKFWVLLAPSGEGDEWWDFGPYLGFYPGDYYEGSLRPAGEVQLTYGRPTPEWVNSPSGDYCASGWTRLGGTLTGLVASDGSRFEGEVVERFQVPNGGAEFTIRSRFELVQTSYDESF